MEIDCFHPQPVVPRILFTQGLFRVAELSGVDGNIMASVLKASREVVGIEFRTGDMLGHELVDHEENVHADADHLLKIRWRRRSR